MPVILSRSYYRNWLDSNATDTDVLMDLLAAGRVTEFWFNPVSTAVNSVRNNGPELIKIVSPDSKG
jgi:putative SOS response-associated peptidase YedK